MMNKWNPRHAFGLAPLRMIKFMVMITVLVVAALQELVIMALVVAAAVILRQSYPPQPEPHYYSLMSHCSNLFLNLLNRFVQIPENLKCPFRWSLSILISL